MQIAMFYHSLVSDWNHGNAHFLRGIVTTLLARGHEVEVYEPENGWSLRHLMRERGHNGVDEFHFAYPQLRSIPYTLETLDLETEVEDKDLIIVHEWNPPGLVTNLARMRASGAGFRLLFHDTHHRSLTKPKELPLSALASFDGVLAYGRVIRDLYLSEGWTGKAWTWHEAADTTVFHPMDETERDGDLVWIGNWGDDERDWELREFLLKPVQKMRLRTQAFGVRYPPDVLTELDRAGIRFGGWIPNYSVPEVFSRFAATVHVPRRAYTQALPGIPTIRVFEALACGIPLVCAPWEDAEGLFSPGQDYLVARNSAEMSQCLDAVIHEEELAKSLASHGQHTVRARHTCEHRVDELLEICRELGIRGTKAEEAEHTQPLDAVSL
ncbi:MAG TPA: glycosyltransferase [Terriglobia bacterium]|nr:glycosyltransferase [Terriglobia bacterium]